MSVRIIDRERGIHVDGDAPVGAFLVHGEDRLLLYWVGCGFWVYRGEDVALRSLLCRGARNDNGQYELFAAETGQLLTWAATEDLLLVEVAVRYLGGRTAA